MLVALVPPPVHNLGQRWVFTITLQFFIWYTGLFALLLEGLSKRVVCSRIYFCVGIGRAWSSFGGLRRVVEDTAIKASDSVE